MIDTQEQAVPVRKKMHRMAWERPAFCKLNVGDAEQIPQNPSSDGLGNQGS
jgi:hypothetical protein